MSVVVVFAVCFGLLLASLVFAVMGFMAYLSEAVDGRSDLLTGLSALSLGASVVLAAVYSGHTEPVAYICPAVFLILGAVFAMSGIVKLRRVV